jgi:hypothetical protein
MPWTKYAEINTSQNMTSLLNYSNVVTGNLFYPIMLVVIFIVSFVSSFAVIQDFKKSFALSSWITAIPSFFLMSMGLLSINYAILMGLILAISTAVLFLD